MTEASASPRAHYRRIEAWLEEQCRILPPGAPLPSENDLAERFAVSRMTARHALQRLAQRGLIERRRGAGSFVLPPTLHREEGVLRSFTEQVRERGMTPSSRLLRAELAPAPERAQALGLPGDAALVIIERLRLADGVPIAWEQAALPREFVGVLDADLEAGSLHEALRALGRSLGRASGQVSAKVASRDEATALRVTSPAALLVETRVIEDTAGRPVEATTSAYVASRWVLDTGSFVAPGRSASPQ